MNHVTPLYSQISGCHEGSRHSKEKTLFVYPELNKWLDVCIHDGALLLIG
jgi:hypothetical protein